MYVSGVGMSLQSLQQLTGANYLYALVPSDSISGQIKLHADAFA